MLAIWVVAFSQEFTSDVKDRPSSTAMTEYLFCGIAVSRSPRSNQYIHFNLTGVNGWLGGERREEWTSRVIMACCLLSVLLFILCLSSINLWALCCQSEGGLCVWESEDRIKDYIRVLRDRRQRFTARIVCVAAAASITFYFFSPEWFVVGRPRTRSKQWKKFYCFFS